MKQFKNLFSIFFITILIASCSKRKEDSPPATTTGNNNSNATFYMHLHTNIDTNEVEYGDTAKTVSGRKMTLNLAQLYLSGFKLYKSDGSSVSIANAYLLKTADSEQYLVGSVPAGNYTTVGFNVGIDSTTNAKLPSSYPAGNVLGVQNPSMWFGSTAQGYIFANVSGLIDTSMAGNGLPTCPFNYKIGSNALLQTVKMPDQAFSVSPKGIAISHIIIDYSLLLKSIDMKTENTSDTYTTNPNVAKKIAKNIPGMFRYE